jgi:outer membrane protein assembly factor BamB/cytochrome c5
MPKQRKTRTVLFASAFFSAVAGLSVWQLTAQAPPQSAPATVSAALAQATAPFFTKNCQGCHNTAFTSGDLDIQKLLADPDSLSKRRESWEDIAYKIRAGEMPPKGLPQPPSKDDLDATLETISRALAANPAAPVPVHVIQPMAPAVDEWTTFGYDPQRTNWARGETKITKQTAWQLALKWKLQTDSVPNPIDRYSTLTAPIVVPGVQTRDGVKTLLFVGSFDNTIYAIDADAGKILWTRKFPDNVPPKVAATVNCPNNMNATPTVDKSTGILYFLPNDGKLRGVSLAEGEDRFPATGIVPPYTRNFSLNMYEDRIFASTTRGCQNEVSEIVGIDVASPEHTVTHFYTSHGKGSGPWGRGGIVVTPFGVVAQTADGAYDPAAGRWGSSVVGLNKFGRVTDSFTPLNEPVINARDFDLGSSSPVVFPYDDRTLVAVSAKEGVIYLLDAKSLGGKDHRTPLYTSPRWSNDALLFSLNGMWSVMSTWQDAQGRRWLLAPFYGPQAKATAGLFPKNHGPTVNGQLMAFTVEGTGAHPTLVPRWVSADLDLPGIAVVANDGSDGVILIVANGDRGSTLLPGGRGRGAVGSEDGASPLAMGAGGGSGRASALGASGGGRGGRGPGNPLLSAGATRTYSVYEVDPSQPGFERDAAWRDSQMRPFDQGGQRAGTRYSGGRDTTHAILYALDPETGDEIYSSGDAIDSWNHYGEIAVVNGNVYMTSYDARVFAFGLKK